MATNLFSTHYKSENRQYQIPIEHGKEYEKGIAEYIRGDFPDYLGLEDMGVIAAYGQGGGGKISTSTGYHLCQIFLQLVNQ